jgi:hypothetical protein
MTRVAEKTGLERTHLYRKLKQLGVDLTAASAALESAPSSSRPRLIRPPGAGGGWTSAILCGP